MSQLDKVQEDSKIPIFKKLIEAKMDDGNSGFSPSFDEVILTSDKKIKIVEAMAIAQGYGIFSPCVILAPISYLSKTVTTLTYPLKFLGNFLYFIPYIKKVIILESK